MYHNIPNLFTIPYIITKTNDKYKFNFKINKTTHTDSVNEDYLKKKLDIINKVINEIVKLVCDDKSQAEILNSVKTMDTLKKICIVNSRNKYKNDNNNYDNDVDMNTICEKSWFTDTNLQSIINTIYDDTKLKNMCKSNRLIRNITPYYAPFSTIPSAFMTYGTEEVKNKIDVETKLEFTGGYEGQEYVNEFVDSISENREKNRETSKKLENPNNKYINLFYALNYDKDKFNLDCIVARGEAHCQCTKCDKYNLDINKLKELLINESEEKQPKYIEKLLKYMYTVVYDQKHYHNYHSLVKGYMNRK